MADGDFDFLYQTCRQQAMKEAMKAGRLDRCWWKVWREPCSSTIFLRAEEIRSKTRLRFERNAYQAETGHEAGRSGDNSNNRVIQGEQTHAKMNAKIDVIQRSIIIKGKL